jgi:hypothetical protein
MTMGFFRNWFFGAPKPAPAVAVPFSYATKMMQIPDGGALSSPSTATEAQRQRACFETPIPGRSWEGDQQRGDNARVTGAPRMYDAPRPVAGSSVPDTVREPVWPSSEGDQ